MIYAYIRVSTEKQTLENQKLEINNYCSLHNIPKPSFIEETISGTKAPGKRKLGQLLEIVQKDDTIIASEISRFGRSIIMIMEVLQILLDKGVKVITIKEGYTLDNNIQSKVIAFAFGLSAEIERQLISDRTKAGLERAKAQGKTLGRPKGSKSSYHKLDDCEELILNLLGKIPKSHIAKQLGCSISTLNHYIKSTLKK